MTEYEALWILMEQGIYSGDPEANLDVLYERWQGSEGDPCLRSEIAKRSVRWLLEEFRECTRLGRSCLLLDPILGGEFSPAFRERAGLFGWRIDESLRRAVSMAERCRGSLPMELSTAVSIAEEIYQKLFSTPGDPESIEQSVQLLANTEAMLAHAYRVEIERWDNVKSSGALAGSSKTQPQDAHRPTSKPSEEPAIDFDSVALQLRRVKKAKQAALVEFMAARNGVPVDEVARAVHGDETADEKTVRANADRTNASLVEMGVPLSFRLIAGRMFRDVSPE